MALLDRLDEGIDHASHHLAAHVTGEGRIVGGCAARALETGLFLHLLRLRGGDSPDLAPMAAYCKRYLESPPEGVAEIDRRISTLLCAHLLQEAPPEGAAAWVDATLAAFDHPTQQRKRAFFAVLLADLGITPPPTLTLPRSHDPHAQRWVGVILAALRVLLAALQGAPMPSVAPEVQVILDAQSADGGWEHHVLATIVALLALHRAGVAGSQLERGIRYVSSQLRDDGGIPFIADEDVWITCLCAQILAEARPAICDLGVIARHIVGLQREDGGWPYAEGVRQTDADDSSVALTFLSRFDAVGFRRAIRRGQSYLLSLQNGDGGFPTFIHGAASEAEITAKAILALRSSSDACFSRRLDRAWRWLAANQRSDGSFRSEWKLSATYPPFHVLRAAAASPARLTTATIATVERVRAGAAGFLRRTRRPSGGWALPTAPGVDHPLSTAYALAGLASDREGLGRVELSHSLSLLLEMQATDGRFSSPGDSLGPRPLVYDVPILATAYALLALTRCRRALRRGLLAPRAAAATRAVAVDLPEPTWAASGAPTS